MRFLKFFSFTILLLLMACSQDDTVSLECDKLMSFDEATELMQKVHEERLMDSARIVDNLIGQWGLIGVVPGWVPELEPGASCYRLTIGASILALEDLDSGEVVTSDWELVSWSVNGSTGFYLETNEDTWNNRMGMETFSDNVMFGTGRVDDANTYIYEKLSD